MCMFQPKRNGLQGKAFSIKILNVVNILGVFNCRIYVLKLHLILVKSYYLIFILKDLFNALYIDHTLYLLLDYADFIQQIDAG